MDNIQSSNKYQKLRDVSWESDISKERGNKERNLIDEILTEKKSLHKYDATEHKPITAPNYTVNNYARYRQKQIYKDEERRRVCIDYIYIYIYNIVI